MWVAQGKPRSPLWEIQSGWPRRGAGSPTCGLIRHKGWPGSLPPMRRGFHFELLRHLPQPQALEGREERREAEGAKGLENCPTTGVDGRRGLVGSHFSPGSRDFSESFPQEVQVEDGDFHFQNQLGTEESRESHTFLFRTPWARTRTSHTFVLRLFASPVAGHKGGPALVGFNWIKTPGHTHIPHASVFLSHSLLPCSLPSMFQNCRDTPECPDFLAGKLCPKVSLLAKRPLPAPRVMWRVMQGRRGQFMQEGRPGKVPEHFLARPTRSKRLNSLLRLRKFCPKFPPS